MTMETPIHVVEAEEHLSHDTHVSVSLVSGDPVTLWSSSASVDTATATLTLVRPDRPVIVGRANGWRVPYLDPDYVPTTVVPGTGTSVLLDNGQGKDVSVSRGHFMLRTAPGGVLLVNGVPQVGGGIRPPVNGTYLLSPRHRPMDPGEEYLIRYGSSVVLHLPNGSRVRIAA